MRNSLVKTIQEITDKGMKLSFESKKKLIKITIQYKYRAPFSTNIQLKEVVEVFSNENMYEDKLIDCIDFTFKLTQTK